MPYHERSFRYDFLLDLGTLAGNFFRNLSLVVSFLQAIGARKGPLPSALELDSGHQMSVGHLFRLLHISL